MPTSLAATARMHSHNACVGTRPNHEPRAICLSLIFRMTRTQFLSHREAAHHPRWSSVQPAGIASINNSTGQRYRLHPLRGDQDLPKVVGAGLSNRPKRWRQNPVPGCLSWPEPANDGRHLPCCAVPVSMLYTAVACAARAARGSSASNQPVYRRAESRRAARPCFVSASRCQARCRGQGFHGHEACLCCCFFRYLVCLGC